MRTTVNVIQIGNSRGIILPSKVLKTLGVKTKDVLEIECTEGRAVLYNGNPFASISKGGWYDDPRDAHEIADELTASRVNTRKDIQL